MNTENNNITLLHYKLIPNWRCNTNPLRMFLDYDEKLFYCYGTEI